MTDEQITLAAREICAEQAQKQDNDDGTRYLVGYYDHTAWMRLVEQGIRKGIEQHEAFKQKVSDAVVATSEFLEVCGCGPSHSERQRIAEFIIPKPKPDPLVEVLLDMELSSDQEEGQHDAKWLRLKLDALGFEIREKGQ